MQADLAAASSAGGWTLLTILVVLAILLTAIGVAQARDPARRSPESEAESGDEPE
ncbi:hypothetical protein ACFXPA_32065 [Amycolatopsis sp. NPDC059090]|uniref:hypothetical protein n=1 Tax=unclassified Amycolatopsis TaxID=2618356 RepID=UPI00366DB91E